MVKKRIQWETPQVNASSCFGWHRWSDSDGCSQEGGAAEQPVQDSGAVGKGALEKLPDDVLPSHTAVGMPKFWLAAPVFPSPF